MEKVKTCSISILRFQMQVQRVDLEEKVIYGNCRPGGWRFIFPPLFLVWLWENTHSWIFVVSLFYTVRVMAGSY